MSGYNTPPETVVAAVASGEAKANQRVSTMVVSGFLGGAYIAFGGLLAIVSSSGPAAHWGGATSLITGVVFSLGLILVVIAGSDLLTGNFMLLPLAAMARRITPKRLALNWAVVTVMNLVGALVVAYFIAYQTGVVGSHATDLAHLGSGATPTSSDAAYERLAAIATGKAHIESHLQVLLRAIGCNWLVCLGVWLALAAKDVGGKILGIVFPITAFVALGFDHVVANMFFLPLALFAGVPDVTLGNTLVNLLLAFVGNLVGAAVFVAGAYWAIYGRTVAELADSTT
ncbi:formate/nitrite transporter family protein [Nocardioides ultimimeridianus]